MQERLVANPEIVFRQEGEEALLFNPDTGGVMLLNETGAFVFKLLDGSHTLPQIVDLLAQEYEVARSEAEQDVSELVDKLRRSELVGLID